MLVLKAFGKIRVLQRNRNIWSKRNTRSRNFYDRYLNQDVKIIVFTDEKGFTLKIARNRQNDRPCGA